MKVIPETCHVRLIRFY